MGAAGRQRVLLAVGLLAARADAFLFPGDMVHVSAAPKSLASPRPPEGPSYHIGTPNAKPLLPPLQRAHSTAVQLGADPTPESKPGLLMQFIERWEKDVVEAGAEAVNGGDAEAERKMKHTLRILYLLRHNIESGEREAVFILTPRKTNDEPILIEDVLAIATVRTESPVPEGNLLAVDELVVKPTATDQRQHAKDLITYMLEWSKTSGNMITVGQTPEFEEYYKHLGFDTSGTFWFYSVKSEEVTMEEKQARRKFQMIQMSPSD